MPFTAQPQERCTACDRIVFMTERTVVDDKEEKKVYHKSCIRCATCNKVLTLGNYSSINGLFYCKPHFKQLFATKGNYDEAFGNEKITSKWEPQAAIAPTSFIPETSKEDVKKSEKKETSEATQEKFRKFREEGESNKCVVCDKTVYLAEKLLVEDKDGKRLFHKTCFKCTTCEIQLDLRNYGSEKSKIYCKTHLKEVALKTNSAYVPAPTTFVPEVATEQIKSNNSDKKETSEATQEKFRKFREEGEANRCVMCDRTVYQAERLLVDDKEGKRLFHKACFKCFTCDVSLDLRNYGSEKGKIYCKTHLKEVQAQSLKEKGTGYVPAPTSFVPDVQEEKRVEKGATPDHIAAKFKDSVSQNTEKCRECGKVVYHAEKIVVTELKQQHVYHKLCLKCSKCEIKLDHSSYATHAGKIYCKVHLRDAAGISEPAKMKPDDPYNLYSMYAKPEGYQSLGAQPTEYELQRQQREAEGEREESGSRNSFRSEDNESGYNSNNSSKRNSYYAPSTAVNEDTGRNSGNDDDRISSTTSSHARKDSQDSNSRRSSLRMSQEASTVSSRDSSPSSYRDSPSTARRRDTGATTEEEEKRRRDEERQRVKEERQRKIDEELRREEEERQRRKEERERKLASYDSPDSTPDSPSLSSNEDERKKRREQREKERQEQDRREQEERIQKEREREERRKKREQEEAAEEADRQRKLEERKREREERKRQQEEEDRKLEEDRQKRLEALKSSGEN